ncbi:MAG: ABC transporter substrate-binding protein [Desulfobacteraceae bacterium]|nr:ABC transporter substrate-binding protein [Desulfobacteraceae bacterium]
MKKIIKTLLACCCIMVFPFSAIGGEPVKIAFIAPMSGLGMKAHQDVLRAERLAVEEINQHGELLGQSLVMIELDDQSTPIGARKAALTAVKENVAAVVGSSWSSLSLAIAPILQKKGIPMITFGSTHPDVTRTGDFIFRLCFTDTFQGKVLAQFARGDLNAQTASVLVNASSDYSMGLASVFRKSFIQKNGIILHEKQYRKETLDFKNILSDFAPKSKPSEQKPDIIFVPGHSRDSGLIVKQAVVMGIKATFMGGDAWQTMTRYPEAVTAAEGAYFSSHWHPGVSNPASLHIKKRFQEKYGEEIVNYAPVLVYDTIKLLADAIQCAGSTDRGKIRDAISSTREFPVASGNITFDKNGDPVNKEAVILTFKNGRVELVKSWVSNEFQEEP